MTVDRFSPAGVRVRDTVTPYHVLDTDPYGLRAQVNRGTSVVVRTDLAVGVAAALSALDGWASDVHLLPADIDLDVAEELPTIEILGPPTTIGETTRVGGNARELATGWMLYTSGTTGVPKQVRHTLTTLSRTVVTTSTWDPVWGLLYDPNRMAGLQVILQARATSSMIVTPPLGASIIDRVGELVAGGVTALSATPTLWRQILQIPSSTELDLRQVTLGGEIADQQVLNALRARYPEARIVHVFASTETGAAFSVGDGREGFPLRYLDEPPRGIGLAVRDGVLFVRSPGVDVADADGWVATGDRVECIGDRVLFRGRDSGVINVGGSNVWPENVESVLRAHPDVVEAHVTARPNPMTGNVVVAKVRLAPDADTDRVERRLRRWVREHAPATHVPATIDVVDEVMVSATGKVRR